MYLRARGRRVPGMPSIVNHSSKLVCCWVFVGAADTAFPGSRLHSIRSTEHRTLLRELCHLNKKQHCYSAVLGPPQFRLTLGLPRHFAHSHHAKEGGGRRRNM